MTNRLYLSDIPTNHIIYSITFVNVAMYYLCVVQIKQQGRSSYRDGKFKCLILSIKFPLLLIDSRRRSIHHNFSYTLPYC